MARYMSLGKGKEKVLVLHHWFCDSTLYTSLLPYLDTEHFSWLFMDLRGYGGARDLEGSFSIKEAISDIVALIEHLEWKQFHLVSHAMSSLIAHQFALTHPQHAKSLVSISPLWQPPTTERVFLEDAAVLGGDAGIECIHMLTNRRYTDSVAKKMLHTWHSCSSPKARLAYLHMFSEKRPYEAIQKLPSSTLFLVGEENTYRHLEKDLRHLAPQVTLDYCKYAGHFMAQEAPLYLAGKLMSFLAKDEKLQSEDSA